MANGNWPAIRAAAKALIETATGIGIVHDYARMATDIRTFMAAFADPSDATKINGWCMTRTAVAEADLTNREHVRRHTLQIDGYMGVDDSAATEKTFDGIIDAIGDVWREDTNLGGTCELHEPLQVTVEEYRMIGPALCHHCALQVVIQERLAID